MKPVEDLVQALEARRAAGSVRDWRLFWSAAETSRVGVRDGVRAGVHTPLTIGRSFGVEYLFQWDDGRLSSGAAEKIALGDPQRFLDIVRRAAHEDPDGANFAGPATIPDVPLHSPAVGVEARSGGAASFAPLVESGGARAAAWSFRTWSGSVSATERRSGVRTSRGLSVEMESTIAAYSFWYEGLNGDGHSSRERIPAGRATERLERACALVKRLLDPDPSFVPGAIPVLLHPDVVDSLIFQFVMPNLHGSRIYHGQGAFPIDRFGSTERVFGPSLSLRLEPLVPMDPGSFRMTTEGVPARAVDYIAEGRLVSPILDMKYARRLERQPAAGPSSADSLRLTGPPPVPLEDALRGIDRGAMILSLLGLHTQDASRGDFSVSAPQTLAIRGGTLGGSVKAVLTGNFFDVLRDPALVFVSFEGFRTPGLLFSGSVGVDTRAA